MFRCFAHVFLDQLAIFWCHNGWYRLHGWEVMSCNRFWEAKSPKIPTVQRRPWALFTAPVSGCVCSVSVSRRAMTSGKMGGGRWVWRHTAASGCVSGGWNFSDTQTQERKSCILAHLLRSVHEACVQSLGGEEGHVVVSWFAFNRYICDLFHSRHLGVFTGYTLAWG